MDTHHLYARLMRQSIPLDIPNGECGDWKVSDVEVSEDEAKWNNMRAIMHRHPESMVAPGRYKRLTRGSTVVMSNTPFEVLTNSTFIGEAKGHVLINGLGIGMVLKAVIAKPEVTNILIVENSLDVIKLVAPHYGVNLENTTKNRGIIHYASDDGKLVIAHASAFSYEPAKHLRFGAVWHDIWDTVCADNLHEMTRLHRKYARRADWQGSWCKRQCQILKRR